MDREHDQEVVLREHCEQTLDEQRDTRQVPKETSAVGIRQPPLLEVTTPNGRVWFLVNLN